MSDNNVNEIPLHFVCTRDEAKEIINNQDKFWIGNCGCRDPKGGCKRSKNDVCLWFENSEGSDSEGVKKVTKEDALELVKLAEDSILVTRPFRKFEDRSQLGGICFCCDDCCGYFQNEDEICDKGKLIESTNYDQCNDCGNCVDVCFFKARTLNNDKLKVERDKCYGCGVCVGECPANCIEMKKR
jgi:ferredoxin